MRWVLIVLGLASMAFCVVTAWQAYRSPIRRRWLWTLVCATCAPIVVFDTGSGAVSTHLLAFVLLGMSYTAGENGWLLTVGLPAGALLFRQRQRQLVADAFPALSEEELERRYPDRGMPPE